MESKSLVDSKIDTKIKLAALWTSLLFLYVYADFFDQQTPSSIESFGDLTTPIGPLTPNLLLIFSLILIVPSLMICLSIFMKPKVNKWVNIVIAIIWSFMSIVLLVDTIGSDWYRFYALYQAIEIVVLASIIYTAWKWPRESSRNS